MEDYEYCKAYNLIRECRERIRTSNLSVGDILKNKINRLYVETRISLKPHLCRSIRLAVRLRYCRGLNQI